jgi:hypothetical protein
MKNSITEFNFKFLTIEEVYKLFPKQTSTGLVVAFHGYINDKQILIHDYSKPYRNISNIPVLGNSFSEYKLNRYMLAIIGFDKRKYIKLLGPKFCAKKLDHYFCEPNYTDSPQYGPILNYLQEKTLLNLLNKLELFS